MRGIYRATTLAVVLAAAAVGAADPPIRVPAGPVAPHPAPVPPVPRPDAPVRLAAAHLFVIDGDLPFLVLASPAGLVAVTEEAGPLKVRGTFADGPGKVETRTFKGKQVVTVEAVQSGRVELLVVPVGAKSAAEVIRRTLDVDAGLGPQPPPDPKPNPTPGPVAEGKRWLLVVEESADATPARGKLLTDPALFARIKERGHVFRVCDKDVKDATGGVPSDLKPWLERARGKPLPRLFVVAPDGAVLVDEVCPATAAGVLSLLTKAGG